MKLTQKQIQKVENYLDAKDLTYIDIRLEVLDHMVSDIENTVSKGNLKFDDAFKKSIQKWNPQLKLSSSWIIGLAYNRPKIVIQKANKIFFKWFVLLISMVIITSFIETKDTVAIIKEILPFNYNMAMTSLIIVSSALIGTWYIKILKSKIKSSYLFLFEKQVFLVSIVIALFILISFISGSEIASSFSLIYLPIITILGFILFKRHQEMVKKYQLSR